MLRLANSVNGLQKEGSLCIQKRLTTKSVFRTDCAAEEISQSNGHEHVELSAALPKCYALFGTATQRSGVSSGRLWPCICTVRARLLKLRREGWAVNELNMVYHVELSAALPTCYALFGTATQRSGVFVRPSLALRLRSLGKTPQVPPQCNGAACTAVRAVVRVAASSANGTQSRQS